MRPDCMACCFFRLVESKRRLCMLTGARRPTAGMSGCKFVPGAWTDIDSILGLPKSGDCGNLNFPNQTKPGSGFSRNGEIVAKTKFAIDDFSVNPISHIAEKLEGSLVRPGTRKGQVARLARERTGCLFTFNPNQTRQKCLM